MTFRETESSNRFVQIKLTYTAAKTIAEIRGKEEQFFKITAGKMSTHQRNILEIQKPVEVLSHT